MKRLDFFSLTVVYAGCFLGAGYVSGQELLQFFGVFGKWGLFGLCIAMILFFLVGIIMLGYVYDSGITDMDRLLINRNIPWLRSLCGVVESFFMLSLYVVMSAAVGALFRQMFSVNSVIGSAVFCTAVFVIAVFGLKGTVRVFSLSVPLLVIFTVAISVYSVLSGGTPVITPGESPSNPLISNFAVSAIIYVCSNIFFSIGVLANVGGNIRSKKHLVFGVLLGTSVLAVVAFGIILTLFGHPETATVQLPMLAYVLTLHPAVMYSYSILLLCAMFGTSLSVLVAILFYIEKKLAVAARHKFLTSAVISLIVFLCSFVGFSKLVGIVYPICGYLGLFSVISVGINYILRKKQKIGSKDKNL